MKLICFTGTQKDCLAGAKQLAREWGLEPIPEATSAQLVTLGRELLASRGGTWTSPPFLSRGWESAPDVVHYRERAARAFAEVDTTPGPLVWVDFRCALLLPFWLSVFPTMRTVLVIRDPHLEPADAIVDGGLDGPEAETGARLWLSYVLTACTATTDLLVLPYEELVASPAQTTARLATALGLPAPKIAGPSGEGSHVRPSLTRAEAQASDTAAARAARAVYRLLTNEDPEGQEALEALRETAAASSDIKRLRDRLDVALHDLDRATAISKTLLSRLEELENRMGWRLYRKVVETALPYGSARAKTYRRIKAISSRRPRHERPTTTGDRLPAPQAQVPFEFEGSSAPIISVVIPTHAQPRALYDALHSLWLHGSRSPFEVIVVDDASTDETATVLGTVRNVRVQKNVTNLGFARSCAAGVALARGEHILLMNDDVVVGPGSLDILAELLNRNEEVGAAGGKLVYPDGTLQEAGGIIWRDGTGVNYGKFGDPRDPRYRFRRETDYCSGAFLMVRRSLWEEIGGFDDRFAPAYYEDTDLCFEIRKRGHKVVYEPAAEVYHHEGRSHGTESGSESQRLQADNRHLFVAKWKRELSDHFPPGAETAIARYRPPRDVVFVADQKIPTPDRDSGSRRMQALLTMLVDLGYLVVFRPLDGRDDDLYSAPLRALGIEVLTGPFDVGDHLARLRPLVKTCLLSRPEVASKYLPIVRASVPDARVVYDTVDLHFLREERRRAATGKPPNRGARRLKKQEIELVRASDQTFVVSDVERSLLTSEVPEARIDVVPNIHEETLTTSPFDRREGLLFIGGFQHQPNKDAVKHFLENIFPSLLDRKPDLRFYVVGSGTDSEVRSFESDNVIVTGWVEKIDPYLERCRVAVAPLTWGAGIKGKVGQTMGAGLPTVMTPIAAEGLHIQDGLHAFVASDPEGFADRVLRLYDDPDTWARMASEGHAHIRTRYSSDTVKQLLTRALRSGDGD